jgi:hypothetical protein
MWDELNSLMDNSAGAETPGVALWPDFAAAAGEVGLAAGAFEVGWHIGGVIDKWLGITVPAATGPVEPSFSVTWSNGPSAGDWGPTYYDQDPYPKGWIVTDNQDGLGNIVHQYNPSGACVGGGPIDAPSGWTAKIWQWNACFVGYGAPLAPQYGEGFYVPASDAISGPPADYTGQTADQVIQSNGIQDPGYDTTKQALTTALQSGNYPTLTAWLAYQLDPRCYPDPLDSTMTVPSISPDETPTDYIQCLSTLGLNANPTETLGDSQVDWGTPASDVVNVQPAPGVAVNPGSDVTIDANPDTMPTPTQRETDLATALLAKNPGITDENKLDIARSCLDLEDAATGNTDTTGDSGDESFANCSTMPIFITGNDAQSAGQHDLIALGVPGVATDPTLTFSDAYGGVKPAWAQLSRDVSGKDGTWKNTLQPCNSDTPPEAQCDEYPFLSSQQGGGSAIPQPNLQYILGTQNGLQGTRLSQFYSAATPTSLGMNGCNITYGTSFLAIPVPTFATLNTTWACNGRNDS